jgi:hypothetical protein
MPDITHATARTIAARVRGTCRAIALFHYLPLLIAVSRRNARSGLRAVCRRARAMLVWPARRRMLMTRFLIAAMTWGPVPVRTWDRSSPRVTSRTQCSWFSIFQCPRIHSASWAGRACSAGSEVMA